MPACARAVCPNRVSSILERIHTLAKPLLEAARLNCISPAHRDAHDAVLHYFNSIDSPDDIAAVLEAPEAGNLRSALVHANAEFHRISEDALAQRFLATKSASDPFQGSWINTGFRSLLAGQVARWKAAGLFMDGKHGPIVVVGGGAIPQTQVTLYRELNCDVIAVDRDPQSAQLCRDVLKKVGLPQLRVEQCDGEAFDYEKAYLVVVATLVVDKKSVADRISDTSRNALLAPRTPVGLHQMWRTSFPSNAPGNWIRCDHFAPPGSSVATQLYIRKQ